MEDMLAAVWLKSVLSASSSLVTKLVTYEDPTRSPNPGEPAKIERDEIVDDAIKPPYIVFSMAAANDYNVGGPTRVWNNQVWQIKLVVKGRPTAIIEELASLIDAALHGKSYEPITLGSVTGQMAACWREGVTRLTDEDLGALHTTHIMDYRLLVRRF